MCGRFTYLSLDELIDVARALDDNDEARLNTLDPDAVRAHARPRSRVQALAFDGGHFDIAEFSWGFRPTASTDVVFNTRLESALSGTPLWRGPFKDGRCILPVASFFEPHRTEKAISPKTGRQIKRQYEFADPTGAPLLLASVHDGTSLSVLTTEPNQDMRPIHDRMPLILRFHEVQTWLAGDVEGLADRSSIQLAVGAEQPAAPGGADQLSLF